MKRGKKVLYQKEGKVNFYLTVYYHISQGLNPTQIAHKYKRSIPYIQYYIRQLKQEGLIKKVGYGTWETTTKQVKNYYKDGGQNFNFSKKVRGHGFQFKLILPRDLKNWERRIEYLTKNNIEYSLVGNKGKIIRILFKGYKVWLCEKTIIVYYPRDMSFFGHSAKESRNNAIHDFYTILSKLEHFLGANFKIKGKYLFEVPKRHYALIKNELAGYYLKQNKKIEIRSEKGELWALIDNSFNLNEMEQVHKVTAEKDTDNIVEPFMNLLRNNPNVMEEIVLNIIANTQILKKQQEQISLIIKKFDGGYGN